MRCNACWRELEGRAITTTCGHLLCNEDASKILSNDAACPICDQVLSKSGILDEIQSDILKLLKKPLRKLNYEQGNVFENVKKLRVDLAEIQSAMVADPHSNSLREAELTCLKAYNVALKDEEAFLKQKAEVDWLNEGDRNSKVLS